VRPLRFCRQRPGIAGRGQWWNGLGAALAVAACAATNGYGQIDGSVYVRTDPNRYPLAIVAVNGAYVLRENPMPLPPGTHRIRFSAPPALGFARPHEQEETVTVAACRRYYVAAKRASPRNQEWTLVVEHEEPIADCTASAIVPRPRR